MRLTKLRFDMLQLCHTGGITAWQALSLKPAPKRALWQLVDAGYVCRNTAHTFVTTEAGDTAYYAHLEETE